MPVFPDTVTNIGSGLSDHYKPATERLFIQSDSDSDSAFESLTNIRECTVTVGLQVDMFDMH